MVKMKCQLIASAVHLSVLSANSLRGHNFIISACFARIDTMFLLQI